MLALIEPTRLLVPPIADELDLILVERQIGREHRRRARLVHVELRLLLRDRVADADIGSRSSERRFPDQRARIAAIGCQADVQHVALRDDDLPRVFQGPRR